MAKEKKIPHVPDPTWTFTEVVPTIFALTFLAVLVAGACILMANKLRGDVRAANAQERIAAALERAYPENPTLTFTDNYIEYNPGTTANQPKLPKPYDRCNTVTCDKDMNACSSTSIYCPHEPSPTKYQLPTLGGTAKDISLNLNTEVSVSGRTVQ